MNSIFKKLPFIILIFTIIVGCSNEEIEKDPVAEPDQEPVTEPDQEPDQNPVTGVGFTELNPSSDSKIIYVSSSEGDDANDCLTDGKPCKTVKEGIKKMREGFPDHILLKRGDVWTLGKRELDGLTSGRSKTEPTVISYYGESGARPILQGESEAYRQDKKAVKHVRWVGLHFYAYKKDPLNPAFNPSAGGMGVRFIGPFTDILLEDNKFEFTGMTIQVNNQSKKRPADFRLKRNIFYSAYSNRSSYEREGRAALLYTEGVDVGLVLEENVFDTGGWNPFVKGAGASALSHNIYMQWNSDGNKTRFVNNISTRAASHGIQMRSGGLAKDNFVARCALGILIGYNYGGREVPTGTIAHAIDNVISEGASMYRGIDNCTAANVCTGALWGLDMNVNSDADYQARNNIMSKIAPEDYQTYSNPRVSNKELKVKVVVGTTGREGRSPIFRRGLKDLIGSRDYPKTGNISYKWEKDDEGTDKNYVDPDRTLADYNASLGGTKSFDAFMNVVLNRPVGTWDVKYEAKSINNFIREGFAIK